MNSGWRTEVLAVLRKEAVTELRSKSALMTAALFSVIAVIALAFSTFKEELTPTGVAGLFWVSLLFSAMIALPRTFTVEEEQGTGDLLRLMARPHAVFWGKALYNLFQMLLNAAFLSVLFLGLVGVKVNVPWLFVVALLGSGAALAGAVTLCGALVAQAANRAALAATVALPLLVPLIALGVAALRVSLGQGFMESGVTSAIGLLCYGVVSMAIGPWIFAAVWKS